MADIDDLFRAASEEAGDAGGAKAAGRDRAQDASLEELDLGSIVDSWRREQARRRHAQQTEEPIHEAFVPRRHQRLASARHLMAEAIGLVPPTREGDQHHDPVHAGADDDDTDDGEDADGADAAGEGGPGPEIEVLTGPATEDDQDDAGECELTIPQTTRRQRRRMRREIDRLQRARPLEVPLADDEATVVIQSPSGIGDIELPRSSVEHIEDVEDVEDPEEGSPPPAAAGAEAPTAPVRYPILSRSVLTWALIFLCTGLAFGATAAFWWAHFNSKVDAIQNETASFTDQVKNASGTLETQRQDALGQINAALDPLSRIAQPQQAVAIAGKYAPSVWFLETRAEDGTASVGSAFVVQSDKEQSLLLTSLDVVKAATVEPAPTIVLQKGSKKLSATLWSWDVKADLALLVVKTPSLKPLAWAADSEAAKALGSSVYVVSGLGGAGASATPGLVVDQSTSGFQHTAVIGSAYRGGPVLTSKGDVLGVASTAYQPLGFDPGEVHSSVPIDRACATVLVCGRGAPTEGTSGGDPVKSSSGSASTSGTKGH